MAGAPATDAELKHRPHRRNEEDTPAAAATGMPANPKLLLHRRRITNQTAVRARKSRWAKRMAVGAAVLLCALTLVGMYLRLGMRVLSAGPFSRRTLSNARNETNEDDRRPPATLMRDRPDPKEPPLLPDTIYSAGKDDIADCRAAVAHVASIPDPVLNGSFFANTSSSSVLFLHVPRTAGRTFHQCLLKSAVPPSRRCPRMYDGVRIPRLRKSALSQRTDGEEGGGCGMMASHDDFSVNAYLPNSAAWISQVRDPVDRVLSAYEFAHEVAVRGLASKHGKSKNGTVRTAGASTTGRHRRLLANPAARRPPTPPENERVSTRNVWPWSVLVPFVEAHMYRRRMMDGAHTKGIEPPKQLDLLEEDGVPLIPQDEPFDPYRNNVFLPLEAFIESRVVRETIHDGATLQLAGFTHYSLHREAAAMRRCVRQSHPLDRNRTHAEADIRDAQAAMVELAKRRLYAMSHFGLTDRLRDTVNLVFAETGWRTSGPAWRTTATFDNLTEEERRIKRLQNARAYARPVTSALSNDGDDKEDALAANITTADTLQRLIEREERDFGMVMPPFWGKHPSEKYPGHFFYHNSLTRESQWERPEMLERNETTRKIFEAAMAEAETILRAKASEFIDAANVLPIGAELPVDVAEGLTRAQSDVNQIALSASRAFGYTGKAWVGDGPPPKEGDAQRDPPRLPVFSPTSAPPPGVLLPDDRFLISNSSLVKTYLECERRSRDRYERKRRAAFAPAKDALGRGPVQFSKDNRRTYVREALRKRIRELNPMDTALYDAASKVFEQRVTAAQQAGLWPDVPQVTA